MKEQEVLLKEKKLKREENLPRQSRDVIMWYDDHFEPMEGPYPFTKPKKSWIERLKTLLRLK